MVKCLVDANIPMARVFLLKTIVCSMAPTIPALEPTIFK